MRSILLKHPVISYFILAFTISWGAVLTIILPGSVPAPPDEAQRDFVFVYLGMLLGPSLAGLFMTMLTEGRVGLRDLVVRLSSWRVDGRWYAVALLSAPVAILATLQLLAVTSPGFVPGFVRATDTPGPLGTDSMLAFLLTGLAVGIGAGIFEEIGWTGYATRRIGDRVSVLSSGLVIGTLWSAWHLLVNYWGGSDAIGEMPMGTFLVIALFSYLPPYRVLMTWVYRRTQSLPVAIVMHATLTSSLLLFGPAVVGMKALQFNLAFGAALWLAVGLTLLTERRLERRRAHGGSLGGLRPGRA